MRQSRTVTCASYKGCESGPTFRREKRDRAVLPVHTYSFTVIVKRLYQLGLPERQNVGSEVLALYFYSAPKITFRPHQQLIDSKMAAKPVVSDIPSHFGTARIHDDREARTLRARTIGAAAS